MLIQKKSQKIETKNSEGDINGYLVPIYNKNDTFYPDGMIPEQVYLTVINPKQIKGPHLHFIRTGCFTCIKGNARFVLKTINGYEIVYSGEDYHYSSVVVPTGTPAALQNIGEGDAYILNMPSPAWTPSMNDEHTADFSDFDFNSL